MLRDEEVRIEDLVPDMMDWYRIRGIKPTEERDGLIVVMCYPENPSAVGCVQEALRLPFDKYFQLCLSIGQKALREHAMGKRSGEYGDKNSAD